MDLTVTNIDAVVGLVTTMSFSLFNLEHVDFRVALPNSASR